MPQVACFDIMASSDNGAAFEKIFYQTSDALGGFDGAAGVFVSLFEVNRCVRPQAESAHLASVIEHPPARA